MDPVSKASFGVDETLRIVIPGYYSLAAIYLFLTTLGGRPLGVADSFPLIMAGLVLGFILYAWDFPNKRAVYNKGQPSGYLLDLSKQLATKLNRPNIELKYDERTRLYFYIFNNFVPQTFHEIVLFRGALYYCVTYVWLISGILGVVGFATVLMFGAVCMLRGPHSLWICGSELVPEPRRICALIIYSTSLTLIWLFLKYLNMGKTDKLNRFDRMLTIIFRDQIEWLELNKPLVEHLLINRVDPRAYAFLKLVPGEKSEHDHS